MLLIDRQEISDDAADAIPDPPADPITCPGDIWALGQHRLCCGDATDVTAVAALMQGEQATLMFTSPPYAQQRDYGAAKEKVGDWDALMQGVFTAAPVAHDAQVGGIARTRSMVAACSGWRRAA
jgi:DNA modification methylase